MRCATERVGWESWNPSPGTTHAQVTAVRPLHYVSSGSDSSFISPTQSMHDSGQAEQSRTLYLLVQELVGLIEVPATREVWVTASSSASGGEEVARTQCRKMIHNSTAWNDVLELKFPTSSLSNVHIAVWERSHERNDEPLASGEFLIPWTSYGFSDDRLCLDSRLRLRLAVSWLQTDVEMLQKGLVPSSPHHSLKSVTLQP